jgi:hypothetical protein
MVFYETLLHVNCHLCKACLYAFDCELKMCFFPFLHLHGNAWMHVHFPFSDNLITKYVTLHVLLLHSSTF